MDGVFTSLLDEAVSEIERRDAHYLRQWGVGCASPRAHARQWSTHPLFEAFAPAAIEGALEAGLAHLAGRGVDLRIDEAAPDPVGNLLMDSILDALAASRGGLSIVPSPPSAAGPAGDGYQERQTRQGVRYRVGGKGERTLVLINACGMPLSLWSRLLGDPALGTRCLAVESRSSDPIQGGMRECSDLPSEARDIAAVLDEAAPQACDLVAWCNGGRLAIEVAALAAPSVRSLILVSPTLRGIAGVPPRGTAFEDDMSRIFMALAGRPSLAEAFAETFRQRSRFVWPASVPDDPARRAAVLFGFPAMDRTGDLVAPLLHSQFLSNYGRRELQDQQYPVHEALTRLAIPMMLVTGEYDDRVNNAFTRLALERWGPPCVHVRLSGAGHYSYDLQYPYFRNAVLRFLAGRQPEASARVRVEPPVAPLT